MERGSIARLNRRRFVTGAASMVGLAAAGAPRLGRMATAAAPAGARRMVVDAQATGEIEFSYYNWGPESIEFFKNMAAAFEQAHPGTTIKLSLPPVEQYTTKLKVLLATGDGPDVVTTTDITSRLVTEERLLDLTDRIQQDPVLLDPNAYIQSGWELVRFGTDRYYGMYSGADTLLLYFNKTLFDQAEIPHPTPDWTWDNFVEAAKALTVREGDRVTQWGTVLGSLDAQWGWANLVWMEGGDIVDSRPFYTKLTLNNEPVLKVLRFVHDLVYTHKVAPTPSQSETVADQGGFVSGRVAMMIDGGWSIAGNSEIDAFEWDIETLPQGSQGFVGEFWPGAPMQISAGTKNPELAWEYVRWFAADKTAQELIAKEVIQVPGLLEIARSPAFLAQPGMPPNAEAWVRSLENARPGDIIHEKQQELMDKVWIPNWDRFQQNKMTPEEFAKTVEEEGNKLLQGS